MRLCDETITVLNSKIDEGTATDVYFPSVIKGVSWFCETISTVDSSGLRAADRYTVRIPFDADFSEKAYAAPAEYTAGDAGALFTLKNGDIIAKGEFTDADLTPAKLKALCAETFTILGVTDNRRAPRGKHWKVVGK